jgi:hypothetical protein
MLDGVGVGFGLRDCDGLGARVNMPIDGGFGEGFTRCGESRDTMVLQKGKYLPTYIGLLKVAIESHSLCRNQISGSST